MGMMLAVTWAKVKTEGYVRHAKLVPENSDMFEVSEQILTLNENFRRNEVEVEPSNDMSDNVSRYYCVQRRYCLIVTLGFD